MKKTDRFLFSSGTVRPRGNMLRLGAAGLMMAAPVACAASSAPALQPDAVVTSHLSVAEGGVNGLLGRPGIASMPVARNRHVVALDDLLLPGFDLRVGEALQQLSDGLADLGQVQGFAQALRAAT